MQNAQNQDFQARLARLNGARTGVAQAPLDKRQRRRAQKQSSPLPSWRENIVYPMQILGAFLIGMVAVFASRYARFHVTGGTLSGEDADLTMMIDAGLGIGLSFVLVQLFRLEDKEFKAAQTFGVIAMVATMHNAVHWAPAQFEQMFSRNWVASVIDNTEPNSILFRGVSFVVKEPDTPKREALPQILTPMDALEG